MSNQLDLSERMALRKRNAGLYVGTHAAIVGQTLSDIAPVMTQAVSALTVGYATFEGVQHYFGTHWILSIFIGIIAAIAVEAVGFVAVDERDKAEAHNRRTPDKTQHVDTTKAQIYVASSFVVTIALVATFESAPAVVRWWGNEASLGEMLFRVGLLVFPFLSRLGANLFAFRSVREGVDHSAADLELRDLELSLRKDEMRAKYAAKVAKYDAKAESVKPSVKSMTQPGVNSSGEGVNFTPDFTPDFTLGKGVDRRVILRKILADEFDGKETGFLNKSELARRLDISRPTLNSDLAALIESGELSMNGHIRVS